MRAVDVSNYTDPPTPAVLDAWQAAGVGLVIVQAFPPSYADKYAEQMEQERLCHERGLPFDNYLYDYLGDPTWRDGCLEGMSLAVQGGLVPRAAWLDEEDVETERGWSTGQRVEAIQASCDAVDTWCAGHAVPGRARIYTAAWWWVPLTDNSTAFADRDLWTAQYDGVDDASVFTPYGGWDHAAIKQYAGTSVLGGVGGLDLDVLSIEEEAAMVAPEPEPPATPARETPDDWQWSTWREAAINLHAIAAELGQQAASTHTAWTEAETALATCTQHAADLSAQLTQLQRAGKDDWKNDPK